MKELSPVPPDVLAVETRDLRKEFVRKDRRQGRRRVAALADVSLDVARGECVAILGQNGSGKSTLVRLLSTLLLPDGGSARVFGYDVVRSDKDVRRLVNRVSVDASFFKKMSASENLHYAARFYGMTPSETGDRILAPRWMCVASGTCRQRATEQSRSPATKRAPSPACPPSWSRRPRHRPSRAQRVPRQRRRALREASREACGDGRVAPGLVGLLEQPVSRGADGGRSGQAQRIVAR